MGRDGRVLRAAERRLRPERGCGGSRAGAATGSRRGEERGGPGRAGERGLRAVRAEQAQRGLRAGRRTKPAPGRLPGARFGHSPASTRPPLPSSSLPPGAGLPHRLPLAALYRCATNAPYRLVPGSGCYLIRPHFGPCSFLRPPAPQLKQLWPRLRAHSAQGGTCSLFVDPQKKLNIFLRPTSPSSRFFSLAPQN